MKIFIKNFCMFKMILILLLHFSFSNASDSIRVQSDAIIIDFQTMNLKEKVKTLRSIKKNSGKVIIYLSKYRLEIENIISIKEDSIKVELLGDWWWNKPKQPVFYNISPIESMTDQYEASYRKVIAIEDITAIQLIKEKPLILLLLPGILVLVLMKSFGL